MMDFKNCISILILLNLLLATTSSDISARAGDSLDKDTVYYHGNSSLLYTHAGKQLKDTAALKNVMFADGMVSVDCLRCLCLKQSNCKPVGCKMRFSQRQCGYFQITDAIWIDCGRLGPGWKKCANDVMCSSQCIQIYMKRYAERYNCALKCEGYTRELFGGPNGCNNPVTIQFWNAVQKVPGCKGVE